MEMQTQTKTQETHMTLECLVITIFCASLLTWELQPVRLIFWGMQSLKWIITLTFSSLPPSSPH